MEIKLATWESEGKEITNIIGSLERFNISLQLGLGLLVWSAIKAPQKNKRGVKVSNIRWEAALPCHNSWWRRCSQCIRA